MNNAVLLAFCSTADRERVDAAHHPWRVDYDDILLRHGAPILLLAIGPDGGAELARWIEAHGLDGVACIGLVGVTAPWAERGVYIDPGSGVHYGASCISLGPLEPLRAVAERARAVRPCATCGPSIGANTCLCACHRTPRLVLACAPDDGRCGVCGGRGWSYGPETNATPKAYSRDDCSACSGTGKALSSRDVAYELVGSLPGPWSANPATFGGSSGVQGLLYPTRADLDKYGIRAVIEILTQ